MKRSNVHWRSLLWSGLVLVCLTSLILRNDYPISEDIASLIPHTDQDGQQEIIQRMAAPFDQQILILLGGPTRELVSQTAKQLVQQWQAHQVFEQVQLNNTQQGQQLASLYFPYRFMLLNDQQQQALASSDPRPDQLKRLWQQLNSPTSPVSSSLLNHDPWLLFPEWLSQHNTQHWQLYQGIALHQNQDGFWTLIRARFNGSAFDPGLQQQLIPLINTSLNQLPKDITVARAGLLFHATAATDQAQQEITLIGGLSIIGIITLVFLAFASLRPLLLILLSLGSGLLAALTFCWWWFDSLQLLTLVFGTSLIGIAVDYSFHWCCERQVSTDSPTQTLRHLAPALTLSAASSLLAYLTMTLMPLPAIQQMATFCAIGLAMAALTLWLLAPSLAPNIKASRFSRWLWQHLPLPGHRVLWMLLGGLLIGLTQVSLNDDIRALRGGDPALLQQEQQVRQLVQLQDNQFFIVRGAHQEQLLQRDEALRQQLAHFNGIDSQQGVSEWLPSQQRQQRNYALQAPLFDDQGIASLAQLGFDTTPLKQLQATYHQADGHWLTISALAGKLPMIAGLYDFQNHSPYVIRRVQGIQDLAGLEHIADTLPGVSWVDPVATISQQLGHLRLLTWAVILTTLVIATILLSWRLSWSIAWRLLAVPVLGGLAAIGGISWLGQPLTLFHSLALLLVLGIGIDYALFHQFARQHRAQAGLATTLAGLSTLLAFGTLAFSHTPALAGFGLLLSIGILVCYSLAPALCRPRSNTPLSTHTPSSTHTQYPQRVQTQRDITTAHE